MRAKEKHGFKFGPGCLGDAQTMLMPLLHHPLGSFAFDCRWMQWKDLSIDLVALAVLIAHEMGSCRSEFLSVVIHFLPVLGTEIDICRYDSTLPLQLSVRHGI